MSSNSFFSQSSTVVLPPAAQPCSVNGHYVDQTGLPPAINGISPNGLSNSNNFVTPMPSDLKQDSIAGRKRSRGDLHSQVDEDDGRLDGSVVTPSTAELKQARGTPVYGPGMTLLYPSDPGYALAAESQSGTWVGEKTVLTPSNLADMKRPSITSRKSQRIDSHACGSDDLAQLVLPPSIREATSEPLIDEATRTLGISWTRMDSNEAHQINQKAYSRWISNHYPGLKDVAIWFENSAIPGYLVAAVNAYSGQQEYYIFSHDLTEARLVTNEPSSLVPRLQMLPALHLAAPGGHIRAETDPITAAQNEVNATQTEIANKAYQESQFAGGCAAHAMELD